MKWSKTLRKKQGCRFIFGEPGYVEGKRDLVKPAVIAVDSNDNPDTLRIVDEESFGPSASLYVVDSDEEAIKLANRSAFGLNASIHTRDMERGMRIGRELEYGQVHINFITPPRARSCHVYGELE